MAMAIPRRIPAPRLNTVTTYTLAHTAQCKLKLAANRPDRNLRFVLGHAFTLDNLMLRIVEIENNGAKSVFVSTRTGWFLDRCAIQRYSTGRMAFVFVRICFCHILF
jgi:hypothetical protein